MKLVIIATLMTLSSMVGVGLCVYLERWESLFLNAPFLLQFAYVLARAYEKAQIREKELEQRRLENKQLQLELKKLKRLIVKLNKLGDQS